MRVPTTTGRKTLGTRVVVEARASTNIVMADVLDTTYLSVPYHTFVPGETFYIEIRSRFKSYLNSAGLKFTVGAGLSISNVQLSSGFNTASSALSDAMDEVSALFAGRKDGAQVEPMSDPTDEVLLRARIAISSGISLDSNGFASLPLEVTLLKDLTDQQNRTYAFCDARSMLSVQPELS